MLVRIKKMKYWRFLNDAVIHRVTDISYQTTDENLLLIGIKGEALVDNNESELMIKIKKSLLNKKNP